MRRSSGRGASRAAREPARERERAPPARRAGESGGTGGLLDVQRLAGNRAASALVPRGTPGPDAAGDVLQSPGHPLDPAVRATMQSRFGHDFGEVRVHDDAAADTAARALDARAYTVGTDIVFERGAYAPGTASGRHLLAHELAHVVQQGRGRGARHATPAGRAPHERAAERAAERDAEGAAVAASAGDPAHVALGAAPGVAQRQPAGRTGTPTAEELGEAALVRGPSKAAKKELQQAAKLAERLEKGSAARRVDIPAPARHRGVRPLSDAQFVKEAANHRATRAEGGLPEAFIGIDSEIAAPRVAMEGSQTIDTNVTLGGSAEKSGGKVWVTSATLPWTLTTEAFLNVDRIDPRMLKPTDEHERGHRAIADRLHDRLATLLRAELEGALPSANRPRTVKGKDWESAGISAVVAQIDRITNKYLDWFEALSASADQAWDTQERQALSRIASARLAPRQPTAPVVDDAE